MLINCTRQSPSDKISVKGSVLGAPLLGKGLLYSTLAILGSNRVWVLHSNLELGMIFQKKLLFLSLSRRQSTKPFTMLLHRSNLKHY